MNNNLPMVNNKVNIFDAFEEYINIGNRVSPEILISLGDIDNVDRFIDTIAANIYLKSDQKQWILEEFDVKKRLELIYTILLEEIEILTGIPKTEIQKIIKTAGDAGVKTEVYNLTSNVATVSNNIQNLIVDLERIENNYYINKEK